MKILSLIIALYFICYINCETIKECGDNHDYVDGREVDFSPKSADDCKDRKVSEGNYKCCYSYGSKQKEKGECESLDKYQYEKIGKYIQYLELRGEIYEDKPETKKEMEEYGDIHIDCFSEYIKMSLISFLLLLF